MVGRLRRRAGDLPRRALRLVDPWWPARPHGYLLRPRAHGRGCRVRAGVPARASRRPWRVCGRVPAPAACARSRTRPSGDAGRPGTGPAPAGWPPALRRGPSPHPFPGLVPRRRPARLPCLPSLRRPPRLRGRPGRPGSLRRRHLVRGLACSPRCSKLPSPPVAAARAAGGEVVLHPRGPGTCELPALLAVFVLINDLGVFYQVIGIRGLGGAGLLLLGRLVVEHLGELVRGGHQRFLLALDLLDVAAGERLLGLLYGLLYLQLGVGIHLAVHVLERTLDGVHQIVRVVADVSLLAAKSIFFGVRLRVLHHLLDLRVRETAGGRDRDPLLLARPEILGPDIDYAVRVYVEGDLDLGYAPGRRRDADQLEVADDLVVRRYLALALVDLDLHRSLVVVRGRKYLTLARRYGGVPLDELGEHPALGLNAEGQRRDVEEQHVLDLASEHAGLDGGPHGYDLVGVDALVGLFARDLLDLILDRRDAGRAADEDHLVDLAWPQTGVLHRLAHGTGGRLDEIRSQVVELRPAERQVHVLRTVLVRRNERQIYRGAGRRRELPLGLLGRLDEPLGGHLVLREVYALRLLELGDHPLDDLGVEVVTTEVVVAARGLDLEDPLAKLQYRDVERTATQVEDEDGLVVLLVHAVGQRRRRRLVDDPLDVQPGDPASVLGSLALGVLEVRRYRDDGLADLLTQIFLGVPLELLQNHRRDLRRRVLLVVDPYPNVPARTRLDLVTDALSLCLHFVEAPTHKALDRIHGALRVRDRLPPRKLPYQPLSTPPVKSHHRWRRPLPLGVGDHRRLSTLEYRNSTVGRAQVYANALGHAHTSYEITLSKLLLV